MKKGINIKNVIVSLVFLIIGIGMLLFVLFVVLPAMTHNAEVCTLEVEAVVIENEPYWTTTGDGESVRRYRQIGEYTVDNKKNYIDNNRPKDRSSAGRYKNNTLG